MLNLEQGLLANGSKSLGADPVSCSSDSCLYGNWTPKDKHWEAHRLQDFSVVVVFTFLAR